MPIITLRFQDKKIRDYPIDAGQSCTTGRKQSNDIVIDNLAVSGKHELFFDRSDLMKKSVKIS